MTNPPILLPLAKQRTQRTTTYLNCHYLLRLPPLVRSTFSNSENDLQVHLSQPNSGINPKIIEIYFDDCQNSVNNVPDSTGSSLLQKQLTVSHGRFLCKNYQF
jgi:hypothetical protein